MTKNVGNLERVVRAGIAALFIIAMLAAWSLTGLVIVFGIIALYAVVTAILGVDPVYTLLHKSTIKS